MKLCVVSLLETSSKHNLPIAFAKRCAVEIGELILVRASSILRYAPLPNKLYREHLTNGVDERR